MENIKYRGICPICNSLGVISTLEAEGKLAKTIKPDTMMVMFLFKGDLIDPMLVKQYPMGTKITKYVVAIDVCSNPNCGTVFATHLELNVYTKTPQILVPTPPKPSDLNKPN